MKGDPMRLPALDAVSGSERGLLMKLHLPATNGTSAAEVTDGTLHVSIGGQPIWHGKDPEEGFRWTWIELVEFWGRVWSWMRYEELPFRSGRPSAIACLKPFVPYEFEETHDLAQGVQGAVLPSLWVVPDRRGCWLLTEKGAWVAPAHEVFGTFEMIQASIIRRLLRVKGDPRAAKALEVWHRPSGNKAPARK